MYQINTRIWHSTGTEKRSMKNMIEQKHLVPIMAQYTETKKKLLSRELIKLVEGKKNVLRLFFVPAGKFRK